jgi:ABC-type sugar transport system ATPase subunit
MSETAELSVRREAILKEIGEIQIMRKGVLNAIYQKVTHKDGEVVVRGPYYKLSRKGENNKTLSWSVPKDRVERVQEEVDNYRRFRRLAEEYVEVCEEMALLEGPQSRDDAKKN